MRIGARRTSTAVEANERLASWMLGIGICLLGAVAILAILAPLVTSFGPREITLAGPLARPGGAHFLGTDRNGMDVWSRVLGAARTDLTIAVAAVAVGATVGSVVGATLGYVGGRIDDVGVRVLDTLQAFPSFIFALAVAALLGPGAINLAVVLAVLNAPAYARLVRAEARAVRDLTYVEAARVAGTPGWRVLVRHVLPNSLSPVRVIAPLNCGWAMLTLAGLSFLGLGIPVLQPEWGAMISVGVSDAVAGRWWTTVPPGIALVTCVLGFSLIGEALQERADRRVT